MSRRALAEKRPLVFASILAALAFYYLRWQPWPEAYLIPLKGSPVAMLALYLWLRHSSPDARLMAWAFGAAALGDMAIEVDRTIGALLFFLYHVLALSVYLRNRRPRLTPSQKWAVVALLLLTPAIAWWMPHERADADWVREVRYPASFRRFGTASAEAMQTSWVPPFIAPGVAFASVAAARDTTDQGGSGPWTVCAAYGCCKPR